MRPIERLHSVSSKIWLDRHVARHGIEELDEALHALATEAAGLQRHLQAQSLKVDDNGVTVVKSMAAARESVSSLMSRML